MQKTDFLVIGSGLAGLSFAVKMARHFPDQQITVITKDSVNESNTRYAQGGIAVVTDLLNDDFDKHKKDTLIAGDGLCDEYIVDLVVKEGPFRLQEIIDLGAEFDRSPDGSYHLGMEGAHSARRILHYKDVTGFKIQSTLLDEAHRLSNVHILEHHFAVDLITQHHLGEVVTKKSTDIKCFGAYSLDLKTHKIETYIAKTTILASGGIGQVYQLTTNPAVATGDGIAMAYRAKALLENMQFVQFHPTALYGNPGETAFLISEAVRGFGAILKTRNGKTFMEKYDERGSLASRDIVARAIDSEMKASGDPCVFLDCRHLDIEEFKEHFPNIYQKCLSLDIDVAKDMIPVAPAAHYVCGGVKTDEWGRTNIDNLYCCGEIACTGLHGANRLASNSLLEALIFAHRCYLDVIQKASTLSHMENIPEWQAAGTTQPREWVLINHNRTEVKNIMSDYVSIVRSNERLQRALNRLEIIHQETERLYKTTTLSPQLCELRNLINVAYLIVKQSIEQKENRGTFYNVDIGAER
ncbi:L-aspartate oxidase [Fulvivirga imtechensis AK7]|uniref:L-aspartate oxidase n=1 Tax=Fulvivirga imtechensis AK7 TaxID=1237149 RepID=L8JKZ0_9BACT|nr:L-aspartate oxidase [Fulvivirga imtechensis]ELR69465.1 L-aspartate oxidase [Fulvivirga imtechensis AK7]